MIRERIYEIGGAPAIIAHRGGGGENPENSAAAFAAAFSAGFRHFETDTRATRDGVAVIFHDETLERTTDGIGAISDYTWNELSKIRDRSGERLMRVDELLDAYPEAIINIDIKSDDSAEPFFRAVERTRAQKRICVASFSRKRIRLVHKRMPSLATSMSVPAVAAFVLASRCPQSLGRVLAPMLPDDRHGAEALQVPPFRSGVRVLDEAFVRLAHSRGQAVHAWTINDLDEIDRLRALGVDGFITDVPTAVRSHLRSRGIEPAL